jgi:23S rRNA (guanine1835-N2)-methyltransferase
VSWSDSYISHSSARHNIALNQLPSQFTALPMTDRPEGTFELIIIKIPKSNALLEYQLKLVSTLVDKDTLLIGAGMSRHIHSSTLSLFDEIIGSTNTSLAVKKARLIFSTCTHTKQQTELCVPGSYYQQDLQLQLSNHANVFSREKLDIGARFMIEQFSKLPRSSSIIDLACGNGVLGIMAKRYLGDCTVSFVDESYMAIASAKANYKAEYDDKGANFSVDDCLSHSNTTDANLILCNPPFHQQHSTGDETAWRMFLQSKKALVKGGQLWVVGNRHMNYHTKLQRIFGNCHIVASNNKFNVLSSQAS